MVQPSSLVFVAIIVGWAAYLLPQWLRHREALSQSRGADRHSSGLRVLNPRLRRTAEGPSSAPLLPEARATTQDCDAEAEAHAPAVVLTPSAIAARRRARVLSMLLGLTASGWALVLVSPVFVFLAWLATGALLLDLLALLFTARRRAVRRAVQDRAQAARQGASRPPSAASSDRVERARRPPDVAPGTPGAASGAGAAASVSGGGSASAPPAARGPQGGRPQGEAVRPAAARPESASARVARELAEGGTPWVPVPVPPPTYTLKPAVPRPEPAPLDLSAPSPASASSAASSPAAAPAAAAPSAGTEVSEPTPADAASADDQASSSPRTPRPWDPDRSFADDLDLDAVLARRRVVND